MKIDVLILFEHINRELESALLIKKILIQKGLKAEIRQIGWNANLAFWQIQPRLIVVPWYYDNSDSKQIRQFRGSLSEHKFKIVNLHCEQLSNQTAISFVLPKGDSKNTLHLCWGDYFEKHLIESGISKHLVMKTGSPRLDFFREELRGLSSSKESLSKQFHIPVNKKWVLIVGNYSGAFTSEKGIESLEARGYYNARRNKLISEAAYNTTVEWLHDVCNYFQSSNIEIIYRPHPSEPITQEISTLDNTYANFHIIKKLSIRDWFINCDIGVMWNSTSSVEAVYGDLPIVSLRPYPIPDDLQIPLLENVVQIKNCQELIGFIERYNREDSEEINSNMQRALGYYYYKGDKLATTLTAECIVNALQDEKVPVFSGESYSVFRNTQKAIHYYIKIFLQKIGKLSSISRFRILNDDYISKKEMKAIECHIADYLHSEE